jgi:hypothetical protein
LTAICQIDFRALCFKLLKRKFFEHKNFEFVDAANSDSKLKTITILIVEAWLFICD